MKVRLFLCGADLCSTQRGAEQRGKEAKVKDPGKQGDGADHCHDDATSAANRQQANEDEHDSRHDAGDPTSERSHESNEGVHFYIS
jgi:hypothetical protein